MRVDINKFRGFTDAKALGEVALNIAREESGSDPIYISGLLHDPDLCEPMLSELRLRAEQREESMDRPLKRYRLKVICDEWGNQTNQLVGTDVVRKKKKENYHIDRFTKHIISSRQFSEWKMTGEYEEKVFNISLHRIDEKGCILVDAIDAEYFLGNWGVDHYTRRPLCLKQATTTEPVKAPSGGKLHVHYWRYEEIPADEYDKLPKIEKSKEPLRGYKKE